MACECLAAIDAALPGSGVKAKASLCSDKWARQDISTETQLKPLEKPTLIHIIFPFILPQCWTHAKSPRIFLFIFFLFIHMIRSDPALPGPDTGHISWWTDCRQLNRCYCWSQRWHRKEMIRFITPPFHIFVDNIFSSTTEIYSIISEGTFFHQVWGMGLWQARQHRCWIEGIAFHWQ